MGTAARQRRGSDERARLSEERDFLLASLEDLEREHGAGDVGEADYEALRASYVARAAETLRALAALAEDPVDEVADEPTPSRGRFTDFRRFLGRRRTRKVLGVIGALCVLGIVAIASARFAGVRLPGETASGSTNVPDATVVQSELAEASTLAAAGKVTEALTLYDEVLSDDPHDPAALTDRGWLIRLTGVDGHSATALAEGDAELAVAARLAPRYAAARALDGVALLEDERKTDAALGEFRAALADGASASLLAAVGSQMAGAFAEAHQPVPAALRRYVHRS